MTRHYSGVAVINPTTGSLERTPCHTEIADGDPKIIRTISETRIEVFFFLRESNSRILGRLQAAQTPALENKDGDRNP